MPFDRAPQIVAARDRVLFGSTVDGKIYGLHAQTGDLAWTFATDGPVRFAPTIWKDRAFCTSDDGYLYALRLADGKLLWKKRGGLDDRMILGNQRLTSKWPARGGAAVVSETVYFAAGIWPSDGIFLYALDAETGATKWVNDSSGGIYMAQPHGGECPQWRVGRRVILWRRAEQTFDAHGTSRARSIRSQHRQIPLISTCKSTDTMVCTDDGGR